jgi:hypothetical protein
MPSLSTFAVTRWRVASEGQVPTVAAQAAAPTPVTLWVADGASATDIQVVGKYLGDIADDAARNDAIEAMSDGLITVTQLSSVAVTAPPVPLSRPEKPATSKGKGKA